MEQMNDYQHSRFIENIFQAYYYLHNNDMDKVGNIFRKQKNGMNTIRLFS